MNIVNQTGMPADCTIAIDVSGRESLVVVVKGTFAIPTRDGEVVLAPEQAAPVVADTFYGDPGLSATLGESDYAPIKPRCDVLVHGSAHAPAGRRVDRMVVGLEVGGLRKHFRVLGDRRWTRSGLGVAAGKPEPFLTIPIHHGRAFGGTVALADGALAAYDANPVGRGFMPRRGPSPIDRPLPNTEALGVAITSPYGVYAPISTSPIGRSFHPRVRLAGTYDQVWRDNDFPLLPRDFDNRYFQCAPEDQQIPYPSGDELVTLTGWTAGGELRFRLPRLTVPVELVDRDYRSSERLANLDTLVVYAEERRLELVWRAAFPLRENILDVRQVVIGRMSPAWYRARDSGKTYFPSLGALVREKSS